MNIEVEHAKFKERSQLSHVSLMWYGSVDQLTSSRLVSARLSFLMSARSSSPSPPTYSHSAILCRVIWKPSPASIREVKIDSTMSVIGSMYRPHGSRGGKVFKYKHNNQRD